MSELKEYEVDGTTLLLTDEDAKERGLTDGKARTVTAEVPENNRDVTQQSNSPIEGAAVVTTKAKQAENK